jgi:hypothetical protein
MIRIEFDDRELKFDSPRTTVCNKMTDQMYVFYDETEPVAPKDWIPVCRDLGMCEMCERSVFYKHDEGCPYKEVK